MRFVLFLLALAGLVVSALALRVHYSNETEACSINEKWDCGTVNHSPFAEFDHIPVAAIGMIGYLGLGALALSKRKRLLLLAATIGLLFSLYLTYVEKYILQLWCIYCVTSMGIITLITLLGLAWIFIGRKRIAS